MTFKQLTVNNTCGDVLACAMCIKPKWPSNNSTLFTRKYWTKNLQPNHAVIAFTVYLHVFLLCFTF